MHKLSRRQVIKAVFGMSLGAAGLHGCGSGGGHSERSQKQLNIFSWADYLHPDTIPNFEKRFDIKVVYDTFASNEALLARMQAGKVDYDIIVPTSYSVEKLKKLNLLRPIDIDRLSNYKNLMDRFRQMPYDPGNHYSIPYAFGSTGIAYNTKAWQSAGAGAPGDWDAFWDKRFQGRMTLLEDARETFGLALKKHGFSYNSVDSSQLEVALKDLAIQKPLTMCYTSDQVIVYMSSGDSHLSLAFSGDAHQAQRENEFVRYVIPASGASMWVDNMCIPASAPHVDNAMKWINYILEPEVAAAITNAKYYPTPNKGAVKLIEPDLLSDKTLYPDEQTLDRCETIKDIGDGVFLYDKVWTELKCL